MSDDKISKYLVKLNESLLFDELSDSYLKKAGVYDIMHGIPVPISAGAIEELNSVSIALGMARVIGGDYSFRYANQYMACIVRMFGEKFVRVLIGEGAKEGGQGNFELAIIYFRAAMRLDPDNRDALYLYGRACKDAYEMEGNDEAYVGTFKAESIDAFETLTIEHPDFAVGYYFLGYAYANLGLYVKAKLTWEEFLDKGLKIINGEIDEPESDSDGNGSQVNIPVNDIVEMREEIKERVATLEEPVLIEQGCNMILAGDFKGGRDLLEDYTTGRYSQWWPLWYYLGTAESALGNTEKAIFYYKEALKLSPSNTEIMGELAEIYDAIGDDVNANKYRTKIEVVLTGIANEEPLNGLE